MNKSKIPFIRIVYMIVLLFALGAVEFLQVFDTDHKMLHFVEMIDGETESEERETNEKTEYEFFGHKNIKAQLSIVGTALINNHNDFIKEHQYSEVMTPPPKQSVYI